MTIHYGSLSQGSGVYFTTCDKRLDMSNSKGHKITFSAKNQVDCVHCMEKDSTLGRRNSEMHKLKPSPGGTIDKETYCGLPWAEGNPFCAVQDSDVTCSDCAVAIKTASRYDTNGPIHWATNTTKGLAADTFCGKARQGLSWSTDRGQVTCPACIAKMKEKPKGWAKEAIKHPAHYAANPEGIECIQVTQWMNFNIGNAVKYLWRAGKKGDAREDLEKAKQYIEFEIARQIHEQKAGA